MPDRTECPQELTGRFQEDKRRICARSVFVLEGKEPYLKNMLDRSVAVAVSVNTSHHRSL